MIDSQMPPLLPLPSGPRGRIPWRAMLGRRTDMLGFLARTASEFGDFVPFSVGPWQYLLLNDPDAIRDVLVTQADRFRKAPALRRAKETLGEGLLTSEGEFHRRQRRLAQPALHPRRIAGYAADMTGIAARTAESWHPGQTLDIHEEMMRLALRIVSKTLFDADVDSEVDAIGAAMDVLIGRFSRAMNPYGPILNRLPLPSNYRFSRARRAMSGTIERMIGERRRDGAAGRADLLSMLVRARDETASPAPGAASTDGMTDAQLRDESYTLFAAGHETTANALTFTWHLLGAHPDAEARLHQELADVLGGRPAMVNDLDHLPYARAVIAESMRLYPPAWSVARQALEPLRLLGFEQYEVSTDVIILMSQWVTHRDARWWPDPQRFDPDRWLTEAGSDRPRYAYFPFGSGPRSCIGEAFAWTEAILVLTTIAQCWRLQLLDPNPPELLASITLRPLHGMKVRLIKR